MVGDQTNGILGGNLNVDIHFMLIMLLESLINTLMCYWGCMHSWEGAPLTHREMKPVNKNIHFDMLLDCLLDQVES